MCDLLLQNQLTTNQIKILLYYANICIDKNIGDKVFARKIIDKYKKGIDLTDIDTQKTLEKVIELQQPLTISLCNLINILDKFNLKSKLAEIEKDICDYIDKNKKSHEIIKEIVKIRKYGLLCIKARGEEESTDASRFIDSECDCLNNVSNKAISDVLKTYKELKDFTVNEDLKVTNNFCDRCEDLDITTKFYLFESVNDRNTAINAINDVNLFHNGDDHRNSNQIKLFYIDFRKI